MALTKIQTADLSSNLATTIAQGGGIPKITSIDYPGDDTAADPAGGQTIIINGSNFTAQSVVYLAGNPVSPLAFVNSTALSFTAPAAATGVYSLYVVNSDGATAITVPGLLYSGLPTWSTSSGSIGSVYETGSVSVSLEATGDGTVTYSVSDGNTIPTGLTLNSNGMLTGTVPATDPTTTYTFSVDAIDEQNQETARSFSITFLKDEVTWSSPANGSSYSWLANAANTISLVANSAAESNITFTVQSGSLPANVSISGSDIIGTPNTAQVNTEVVIRATADDTSRYADRTLYFTIEVASGWMKVVYGGGFTMYPSGISAELDGSAVYTMIRRETGSPTYGIGQVTKFNSSGVVWDKYFGDLEVNTRVTGSLAVGNNNVFAGWTGNFAVSNKNAGIIAINKNTGSGTWASSPYTNNGYPEANYTICYSNNYVTQFGYINSPILWGGFDAFSSTLLESTGDKYHTYYGYYFTDDWASGVNDVVLGSHTSNNTAYFVGYGNSQSYGVISKANYDYASNTSPFTSTNSWTAKISGNVGPTIFVYSVTTDSSDNIYVSGLGDNKLFITKLNSSGTHQWTYRYKNGATYLLSPYIDKIITIDSSDNIYFTGYDSSTSEVTLTKINSSGSVIWSKGYKAAAGTTNYGLVSCKNDKLYFHCALSNYAYMLMSEVPLDGHDAGTYSYTGSSFTITNKTITAESVTPTISAGSFSTGGMGGMSIATYTPTMSASNLTFYSVT